MLGGSSQPDVQRTDRAVPAQGFSLVWPWHRHGPRGRQQHSAAARRVSERAGLTPVSVSRWNDSCITLAADGRGTVAHDYPLEELGPRAFEQLAVALGAGADVDPVEAITLLNCIGTSRQ